MLVDATLCIQVVNFLLAYLIFTRIFVKHAYALVRHQRVTADLLVENIEQAELANAQQKKLLQHELTEVQQALLREIPDDSSTHDTLSTRPVRECAHEVNMADSTEFAQIIVDRVLHDINR